MHWKLQGLGLGKRLLQEWYEVNSLPILTEFDKDERAEALIEQTDANILHEESNQVFYDRHEDVIHLPERKQFKGKTSYYDTILHELAHWTGHESRLNRDLNNAFASPDYAKEELIAELAVAFMCADLGFSKQITNSAAYIKSWIGALNNDNRYIFQAVYKAEQATEFIHSFTKSGVT